MGIVRLRSKIHVFFRCPYNPRSCFSSNFYCWCLFSSYTSSLYGISLSSCCCVFFLVRLFFSYLFLFFSSFCFTASPFSINCFLFARDVQQLFTILSSIYLFICCHRSTLSIWWGQFFWRHLCLVYVKFIVKTTASLLCLRTVSIWLIDGTLGTMYPREREKVFRVLVQPPKRTFVHRRSYSFPVLQTPSESVEQRKRRWPLHFCKFYNGRGHLWSHGKHFPRPGRSTMAIWYDEEYVVANLTDKTDYARAEICKFNPCLCIISSSADIIFFFLPCFWKSKSK